MNSRTFLPLALGLTYAFLTSAHAQPQTDLGLQIIAELGKVNGQALACQELKVASRAKVLMLAHAPKSPRFGSAFDESTRQSYLSQINASVVCPDSVSMSARLDVLEQQLKTSLPASVSTTVPDAALNPSTGIK